MPPRGPVSSKTRPTVEAKLTAVGALGTTVLNKLSGPEAGRVGATLLEAGRSGEASG